MNVPLRLFADTQRELAVPSLRPALLAARRASAALYECGLRQAVRGMGKPALVHHWVCGRNSELGTKKLHQPHSSSPGTALAGTLGRRPAAGEVKQDNTTDFGTGQGSERVD
ncbi:hypothetical protein J1605_002893 [Eschrichtius robustus]|uniref:Uncharacterized protein n=1 Tax=Eschrichtius robustus TaxID=9764 RepID=A0AB34HV47_ESCRO|nr:hypothetical protein J1605_002893 [Eschrichtius robustus]